MQWSPAMLRQVLQRTDGSGDMSLLANLCDQIVSDDRFGELLGQLADDVIGCDLTFETSLRSTVGSAEKADELSVDWPIGYDDDELKSIIVWAMLTGVAFAKHEAWLQAPDGRIVPALKWWHPQHFSFQSRDGVRGAARFGDLSNHCWHVREAGTDRWIPIEAGDGTWVIVTRRGEYRPWANGMWRGLAVWWLLKQYAMQDSGVHSEKASKLVVTVKEGSTKEERAALSQYIYDAGKDAVVTLPEGCNLELIEIEANLETLYHSQIRLANESAALTILGQNLSTTVDGGSRAAATEHGKKEGRRVRNASQMLSKNLQTQSVRWWAEFNFGNAKLAPYPHYHTEPPADYAAKAGVLQTAATALLTLKTAGWEADEGWVEEELGLPLKKTKALVAREQAEPGDTDGDGTPHNEPGNVNPNADDEKDPEPKGGKAPKAKPPRPRPRQPPKQAPQAHSEVFLASGDDAADAQGFVRGQLYVDDLSDNCVVHAADELSGWIARLLDAVDGARDYEDARYRIVKAFQNEADPDRLAMLVERGILLANLAGRYAVQEDTPADDA